MEGQVKYTTIFLVFIAIFCSNIYSQWPGCFYAFELKGADGKPIDSLSTDYKMVLDKDANPYLLNVKMCESAGMWRYYIGDKNLYITNSLYIVRSSKGDAKDTMIIKFPPSLSGGKEKFYRNLYAGSFTYKPGIYSIILPVTDEVWDGLKEIAVCPLSYMKTTFYDISSFQK
jgi:hypothetical protein